MSNFITQKLKGMMLVLMAFISSIASAQASVTICDGTDTNTAIPFYFYYLDAPNTTSQVIYPASALTELNGKQISGFKFYTAGYSKDWNANMVVSLAEVNYTSISSENASYISADFKEVFNGEVSGSTTTSTLEFTFDTPYVYTGKNLVVQIVNTTTSSYQSVSFYGQSPLGDYNATYGYSGSFKYNEGFLPKVTVSYGEAQLEEYSASVSSNSLNFATIFTGATALKSINISNNGSAALTANISGVEAPFSVEHSSIEIPSLSSVTLPVTFVPTADGVYNQTMTIDLGQAGTFDVALAGASMTAPTGYQQAFEVGNKSLPEGWNGWSVKSTYDSSVGDYVYESAGASLDYFVGTKIDGISAVAIQDNANPVRSYPSQYAVYMISPKVSGSVMVTTRGTNSSDWTTPEFKAFKAVKAENGTYTIGDEIELTWTSTLNNAEWSNAIFTLEEETSVALFMNYSAVSAFAADKAEGVSGDVGGDDEEDDNIEPITICDGTDENSYIPFYFYYLDNGSTTSQVIYPASVLTEFVGKQITGLKFYHKGFGQAWNSTMAVSLAEVDYATTPEGNDKYIDANFQEVFRGDVSGDESMSTLEFTFLTPYVYTGNNLVVQIKNVAEGNTWMQVPFYGQELLGDNNATYGWSNTFKYNVGFLPKVTITYGGMNEFSANVSEEAIDYSTIFTGETVVKNVIVANSGSADLTANISGVEAPFSVAETSITIPSLTSVTVPVTFAPTADGVYNQTMTIDLGQAGTFDVALSGSSLTAPSGYKQAFDVQDKTLPEHWTGWMVKSTYDYTVEDYVYESAEENLDYFVGTSIDGTQAISIKDNSNPVRSYPSQYEIFMISPEVSGNVMITARGTNSSSYITPRVKLYKATAENGSYVIGDEIYLTWIAPLTNSEWSRGILSLSESTQIAVLMDYAAVSAIATDNVNIKVAEIGDEFTENGLTYIVKSATEVGVVGVSNDVNECVVPEAVTYCGSRFNVVSIERDAFYWSNVTNVTLPSTLTTIAYGAFRSSSLTSVNIPEGVTSIGEYAFYNTDISTIVIPEGVTAIESSTFSQCELLSNVTLPSTLQKIGQGAFYKCAITAIEVPNSCLKIGMYAFESCSQLASVTLPDELVELPMGIFQNCSSLQSIVIPEAVTTISQAAFESTGLTSLHIPASVTTIKSNAFNASPISTITVANTNPVFTLIDGAIYSADKRFIYLYPRVSESKAYDIVDGCVAVIGGAFYGCDIKSVTFPEGFIGIDSYAFCKSDLETVELPNTLSVLWEQAFAGTKLTEIIIPEGVTRLSEALFADCANLTTVTLPTTLTDIANRAFFRCNSLTTINCLGTTPAEFDAWESATDPFYQVDCSKVTVKCPKSVVDDYRASEWGDFFSFIEGADFSGIDSILTGIKISVNGNVVTVVAENGNVEITAMNGMVVCSEANISGEFSAQLPHGVYVISVNIAGETITKKIVL